jgi:hypothetical protein
MNDYRNLKYVGWDTSGSQTQGGYQIFFSNENHALLSKTIHNELVKRGLNMIVAPHVLWDVMSSVSLTNDPIVGDIHSRYVVSNGKSRDDLLQLNTRVLNTIVNTIVDEYDTIRQNARLTKWTSVLGEFNAEGLRGHDILKTKENDYRKGFFVYNY